MPEMRPRTKANKNEQLSGVLQGELATYEKVWLFQHSLNQNSVYRYRGVLLQYQKALQGKPPSLETSRRFLAYLRENGFKPSTLRLYRAALQGFHSWRGENLVFPIRVPQHLPSYHSAEKVKRILSLAVGIPCDHVTLKLMSDAGLRRGEVIGLSVRDVDLKTTAVYLGVAPKHLEGAIRILESSAENSRQDNTTALQPPTDPQPREWPDSATLSIAKPSLALLPAALLTPGLRRYK